MGTSGVLITSCVGPIAMVKYSLDKKKHKSPLQEQSKAHWGIQNLILYDMYLK